jgi:ATP phosphoribosyltransferase regulatory subunit HisZ
MAKADADLKRLRISKATRAWLQAEATTTNLSQQEIVRAVLHEIALKKIRAAKVLAALATDAGHERDDEGHSS